MKSKKEMQKRKVRNKQSGQNKIKGIARKVVRFTCLPCGHVRCTIYGRLTKEWKKYHFIRTFYLLEGDFLKKIFFFLDKRRHSQKRTEAHGCTCMEMKHWAGICGTTVEL